MSGQGGRRVRLTVDIDLDMVPGFGHEAGDWQAWLQVYLDRTVGHYCPEVQVDPGTIESGGVR